MGIISEGKEKYSIVNKEWNVLLTKSMKNYSTWHGFLK